jgi:alcohol dehydrogenase YqhD (iron-dependent ADH family)
MRYILSDATVEKFAEYARNVWDIQEEDNWKAANYGIDATEEFFRDCGIPMKLSEVGIDESNFEFLQAALSNICCMKTGPMDQQSFNPANAQAREIAEKLMRGRQRVAAQKGETNVSVFSQYLSILTVGLHSMSM